MRKDDVTLDLRPWGLAIKEARKKQGKTRDQVASIIQKDSRYLTNIENKGQHTSLNLFYRLSTLFHVSVDQFFFPDSKPQMSTLRRQIEHSLDALGENDLIIVEATIKGILDAKKADGG